VKQLLLYMPVIQAGYTAFLERHGDASEVLLLGASFGEDYRPMRKEIRALPPAEVARYLNGAGQHPPVRVVERDELPEALTADVLVLPAEEVSRTIVENHKLEAGREVVYEQTFLRWDREWSLAQRPAHYDGTVAADALTRRLIRHAADIARYSSDWWRQVGAVVARDGEVVDVAYNRHLPSEHSPYVDGDPRNAFRRGIRNDLSTAIHAEAELVAKAARTGVSLAGSDLYVSTFPCPGCARLVAVAGFQRCYFAGPYSMLDGETVLRAAGVELIWVDLGEPSVPAPGGALPG
jgi:dCMP deaminase